MKQFLFALVAVLLASVAQAQNAPALPVLATCGSATYVAGNLGYQTLLPGGATCVGGSLTLAGTTSNATSGVATSATNVPTVSYNYGFNGTTWDQLQVDGSKNLKVAVAGATSNATSGIATSATNLPTVGYAYGFNGTTWDQMQVDGSKNLKVVAATLPLPTNAAQETGGNLATIAGAVTASVTQVNVKQMNGVATSMGNGTTDTGTQRVTISSDSTGKVALTGNSGAITQSSVSVTNASTALLTAAQFTNFEKICVALTATTGVWVNWANAAAVTATPSEYIPPGQCDSWVKSTGFMPTAAAFAISNSASTIAVTVEGN